MKLTCNVGFMSRRGMDRLYDLAESQGGYLTTAQAAQAAVSTRLLTYYASIGDIERVAHGVYRLNRFPMHRFGEAIAATLWAGPGSVVSHESALAVYGLGAAMPTVIHVTVPRRFRGTRPGVVVHVAPPTAGEMTVWDDVPVTSIVRTLTDVAVEGDPDLAVEAARDALRHGLTTPDQISSVLDGRPDAAGLAELLTANNLMTPR